jgi:hypothetical protein
MTLFKIQILQESLFTQLTYQSWPNRYSRILLQKIAVLHAADLKVLERILKDAIKCSYNTLGYALGKVG